MGLRFGREKLSLDFVANSLEYLTKVCDISFILAAIQAGILDAACCECSNHPIQVLLENPALPGLLREKILSHVKEQALSSAVKMVAKLCVTFPRLCIYDDTCHS